MTDSGSPSVIQAGTVEAEVADGIGTIRFGHPKSNSLPGPLLARLAEAFHRMGQDERVRVIVLRSEGAGPFSGGASFDEFRAIADPESGRRFFSGFAEVVLAMIRTPKLIVVRVQGRAAGGAVGLIAASDYAVAARGADIKLSEIVVGIGPFVVGPVIEKKIGLAAFGALAVDGAWRSADWAERHGLYSEVLETTSALDERVEAQARKFSAYNPEAVRGLKEVLWEGTGEWPDLLARRAAMSGHLVLSEHSRRAVGPGSLGKTGGA